MRQKDHAEEQRKSIVVLGLGFGGLSFCKEFHRDSKKRRLSNVAITVISNDDYVSYTPLLPLVTGGTMMTSTASAKVSDLAEEYGFNFIQSTARNIHLELQYVETDQGKIKYDLLVISTGSSTNHFGIPGAVNETLPLRTIFDANVIKREQGRLAELCRSVAAHNQNYNASLVVIGGGLSGVETAMSLKDALEKESPESCTYQGRGIYLIEGSDRILPKESAEVAVEAAKKLLSAGINVLTGSRVVDLRGKVIHLENGKSIKAEEIIWTAGVKPNTAWLNLPALKIDHRSGRLLVNSSLRLTGDENVFALGDCALLPDKHGFPLPENASVAVREGKFLGKALAETLAYGSRRDREFRYIDFGHTIILGKDGIFVGPHGFILKGMLARMAFGVVSLIELFTLEERRSMIAGELGRLFHLSGIRQRTGRWKFSFPSR